MSLIKVENLSFAYPSSYDNIFEDVSFNIDSDWRLGFVGRNGRGKTTFLKLLCGEYEYEGKIISSLTFDYFPYAVEDKRRLTLDILLQICPLAQDWEIIRELNLLETDAEILYRPYSTLSNGEQTKALLAALFLNDNHFLLIDEPTNHLDLRARETVSQYLKKKKSFILVSHDRSFLDGCADHILSINRANIEVQSGNFSSYFENFERRQTSELAQNKRLKKEIKRLNQSADRASAWSDKTESAKIGAADKGFVGHKAAKMMKRSKSIEKRRAQATEEKSALLKNIENADSLKLFPLPYHSNTLISLSEAVVCYDGKRVSEPVSFSICRGDRIALQGKNGSGKSSLLKLLTGGNIESFGDVNIGSQLVISYVPQESENLSGSLSDFAEVNQLDESLFKAILRKLGFERAQLDKDISDYSQGQKKKVHLAKSLCEKAHLYIWDEPLNYIDIYSRIQLEELIKAFAPTMIFVEHDKAFCDNVANKTVTLTKNNIRT